MLSSGDTVRVVGGTDEHRAALGGALRTVGLRVSGQGETAVRLVEGGDYAAGRVEDGQMPQDTASGPREGGDSADVAVALDVPYGLEGVEAPIGLAAFGDTPAHLAAVAQSLVGEVEPRGTLPVPVGDRQAGATCG